MRVEKAWLARRLAAQWISLKFLKRGALYEMVTGCRNEEAFICLSQEVKEKKVSNRCKSVVLHAG